MSVLQEQLLDYFRFEPLNKALEYPQDFVAIGHVSLGWAFLYFALHKFILDPMGSRLFPVGKGKYLQDRHKFNTAGWRFVNLTLCGVVGCYVAMTESWIFSPPDYFKGWPDHGMSPAMKFYYQMELSSYAFAVLVMPFEPKQSFIDYAALLIHHASTIFLIWTSYIYGFHRVGIVVAFLHDLADPFMEIAKVNLYVGNTKVFKTNIGSRFIIRYLCSGIFGDQKYSVSLFCMLANPKKCEISRWISITKSRVEF
jgi:hypothetical protein